MSKGFFKEEQIQNRSADQPWKKSQVDRLIELYLAGTAPSRLAVVLERNPKAIARKLEQFTYNEADYIERYEPKRRTSRKGKRLTENERLLIESWKKRNVSPVAQARFLQRPLHELGIDGEERAKLVDMRKVGTGVDLALAYRYLYYCKGISLLTDQAYDEIEKEEMEFGAHGQLLKQPGSDNPDDYPDHIRALALYLVFKHTENEAHAKKSQQSRVSGRA